MRGMQLGSYDLMMKNAVENYSGYIQVHKNGYWNDKIIDNAFSDTDSLRQVILNIKDIKEIVPHINSNALAAYGLQSKGVAIAGIVPGIEDKRMSISSKIIKGNYLSDNDDGVLVTEKLAEYLMVDVDDTIVLRSNGYHGISADGIFPVRGIVKFPVPTMNNSFIFMDINTAQYFFSLDNMVTEYCININDYKKLDEILADIKSVLSDDYEVMPWYEIRPDLFQQIESDNISGVIFIGLLYLIIAFGVFGTVMMMTLERKKEFGVMVALGLKKTKLTGVLMIEIFFMGLLGLLIGFVIVAPINYYFHVNPIQLTGNLADAMISFGVEPLLPFAWKSGYFINQAIAVACILFIVSLYPLSTVLKLKIIQALRN
ncbi:MAG: ABC transporter permease [Marinilabiliales bacterium]